MKKIGKIIAPIAILLVMSFVAYLALVMVYSINTDRMQYNASEAAKTFEQEGMYPQLQQNYSSQLDSYTDALMILTAAHKSNENAWKAAINNERKIIGEYFPDEVIQLIYFENAEADDVEYSRYWHGYLLFLKPALCFIGYKEIRYFVMVIEILLFAILIGQLARKNSRFVLPMAITWLFMNPVATMMSLQFCYVTCIALLGAVIIGLLGNRESETSLYGYGIIFMIIGATTSFMDLLTFPLVTLGIPLIVWIVFSYAKKKAICNDKMPIERCGQVLYLSVFWTIGYGGFWALKWIIGNVVTGRNIIGRAFKQVELRSGGINATDEVAFGTTLKHIVWDVNNYFAILFVVVIGVELLIWLVQKRKQTIMEKDEKQSWIWNFAIPLIMVSLYPIVWYRVVYQHTYCHYWFTYRDMATTVFALSIVLGNLPLKKKLEHNNE